MLGADRGKGEGGRRVRGRGGEVEGGVDGSDELKEVHKYLIELTAVGAISRQEAVSMLPPFLLNVQPHHAVRVVS